MAIVVLSGAGHMRLPPSVRERLGLNAGDKLEMRMVEGGFVVLTKEMMKPEVTDIEAGCLKKPEIHPTYVWVRTGHFETDKQPVERKEHPWKLF